MDQPGIDKRVGLPGDEAEADAAKDGAEGLDFRLAQVHEGEGDGLDEDGRAGAEDAGQAKEHEAAPDEFPGEQLKAIQPEQAADFLRGADFVIGLHGGRPGDGVKDEGHDEAGNGRPRQPRPPIAPTKAILAHRLAENQPDHQQRQDKVKNETVIRLMAGEAMVKIQHRHNRAKDDE